MKKYYLLTPGPTPIPPEVAAKTGLPIIHHRTKEFEEIFTEVEEGLKEVFLTRHDVFMIASSGTGAMESAVVNLLSPGDKVLVASCGVFGNRWIKILETYGIKPIAYCEEWGKDVSPEKIKDILLKNEGIKVVYTTHTETSTGTVNDLQAISKVIKENSNAILVVDAISGLGGQELRMDEWNIEVVVTGSQKGLMNAPGLSFVAVNERIWQIVEKATLPRFYFDWRQMKKMLSKKQTPFTPSITLIIGVNEAIKRIKKEGIENMWRYYEKLSLATREAAKALGLEIFSLRPSSVVTAIKSPSSVDSTKLVNLLRDRYGISIADGQDVLKGKIFRIAHMGYINEFDIIISISAVEKALNELGYSVEYGKGVRAAESVLFQ
jgi:aspartate aminotransferase-like enzyme